jgi:hypothetical protein
MAFSIKGLSSLATSSDGGISVWAYRTDDPAAALLEKGHFDGAASRVALGDRIFALARGGAVLDLAVTYRSKNVVHVAEMARASPVR